MHEEFARIGRDLWTSGAVSSHGGNMSVRDGDRILITRTGSMLGHLGEGDVVETSLVACDDARDATCSVELVVHRAIYAATDAAAIVHAHTVHTIVRSLLEDSIVPVDSESALPRPAAPVRTAAAKPGSPRAGLLPRWAPRARAPGPAPGPVGVRGSAATRRALSSRRSTSSRAYPPARSRSPTARSRRRR